MKRTKIAELLRTEPIGTEVTVKGWVKAFRNNQFIALNDGSCAANLQVVVDFENTDAALLERIKFGAAIGARGQLIESQGKGQKIEVKAAELTIYGDSNPEEFPLQPKKQTLEYLREIAHLRFRTNTFGAVFRVRHALAFAVHKFFNDRGFCYLHTPIITASDAEGAGEMFRVTTFDLERVPFKNQRFFEASKKYYENLNDAINKNELAEEVAIIDAALKRIDSLLKLGIDSFQKLVIANQSGLDELVNKLANLNGEKNFENTKEFSSKQIKEIKLGIDLVSQKVNKIKSILKDFLSYKAKNKNGYYHHKWFIDLVNPSRKGVILRRYYNKNKYGFLIFSFFNFAFIDKELRTSPRSNVDFESDFFGRPTNLTVSGQLEGELGATALGEIYTFGPTFRAENSNTTRHLAEFWMIEPEVAFADLQDNMDLAEAMLQYVIGYALEHCAEDLKILEERLLEEEKSKPQDQRSELSLTDKLRFVIENQFVRLTYSEAIVILQGSTPNKKGKFQYPIEGWGADLQSEHERYLVEKHFKKPVILTNYPAAIKAFYMRQDEPQEGVPGPTVSAMDILFPGIGEIVGGSQREERYENLVQRMQEMNIPTEELSWYLDTRRFGSCPHAGFGLGFERLVLFVTGMTNIRDVIAFPRYPGNAEF